MGVGDQHILCLSDKAESSDIKTSFNYVLKIFTNNMQLICHGPTVHGDIQVKSCMVMHT